MNSHNIIIYDEVITFLPNVIWKNYCELYKRRISVEVQIIRFSHQLFWSEIIGILLLHHGLRKWDHGSFEQKGKKLWWIMFCLLQRKFISWSEWFVNNFFKLQENKYWKRVEKNLLNPFLPFSCFSIHFSSFHWMRRIFIIEDFSVK